MAPVAARSLACLALASGLCGILAGCDRGRESAEAAPPQPTASRGAAPADGRGSARPEAVLERLAAALARADTEAAVALYHPTQRGAAARELDDFGPTEIEALRRAAGESRREPIPPQMDQAVRSELGADEVAMIRFASTGRPATVLMARVGTEWLIADID